MLRITLLLYYFALVWFGTDLFYPDFSGHFPGKGNDINPEVKGTMSEVETLELMIKTKQNARERGIAMLRFDILPYTCRQTRCLLHYCTVW